MKTITLLGLMICFSVTAHAGGGWTSGGGDPLRFYFTEGKELAKEVMAGIKLTDLGANVSAEVKKFISENRAALLEDLEKSPLNFHVDPQPTCALTTFERNAPVKLSAESCRAVSNKEEAAKLLVHETAHHFGHKDETFADSVAIAIFAAWETLKVREVPLCRNNEQTQMLERLAGLWVPDHSITQKLGGAWNNPRARLRFVPRADMHREFQGVGKCALQAGTLMLAADGDRIKIPYIVTSDDGQLTIITKQKLLKVKPPKRPGRGGSNFRRNLRQGYEAFYFTLTRAPSEENDLLFIGDEESSEVNSAFNRKGRDSQE